MNYFRILADDNLFANRWFLDEPFAENGQEIGSRLFTLGKPYKGPPPNFVPVQQGGKPIAFNLAALDMPVVSPEISLIFKEIAENDCDFFPVTIKPNNVNMVIVNVIRRLECVDESRSEKIIRWEPKDNRPDRLGFYRSIRGLRIDPMKVNNHHIFRIFGWEISLIISEAIYSKIKGVDNLGVVFREVT